MGNRGPHAVGVIIRNVWASRLTAGTLWLLVSCVALCQPVALRPHPLHANWLTVADSTKTCLRSGFDYNDANYDSGNLVRVEPEGMHFTNHNSAWVLLDVQGPGVITSMWFTGKKGGKAWLGGRLNFHFDGEIVPRLTGELPGLFEPGKTFPAGIAEPSSGGWICYAPLYFARSMKVTLTDHQNGYGQRKNGRGEMIPHLYHQLSYQRLPGSQRTSQPGEWTRTRVWERDETGDVRTNEISLVPGKPASVFSVDGKGVLAGLELQFERGDPASTRLRVRTDGETCVDLGVTEMWGVDPRKRPTARFQSLLMGLGESGTFYSWWPMPHADRIEVWLEQTNAAAGHVRVRTVHRTRWPEPDLCRFRASSVTDITEHRRDITLLSARGRGHFAGLILELADQTLEGDDRFFVDDEPFPPAWHGTGTEDYFRCGWYFFGGPLTRPVYGLLDNARPKIAYRFHLLDRVNFTRSIRIQFEHGHANDYIGPYRGVAFWYEAPSPR